MKALFVIGGSIIVAGLALTVWSGGRRVSGAELRHGLAGVRVVHLVGNTFSLSGTSGAPNSVLPLSVHEDKWFRVQPLATYEDMTVLPTAGNKGQHMIMAGNSNQLFWYDVDRNKVKKANGLTSSFSDLMMATIQPDQSTDANLKVVGSTVIDGRSLDLLQTQGDAFTVELAADMQAHRAYRIRQLMPGSVQLKGWQPGSGDKLVEVSNLRVSYDEPVPDHVFDWTPPKTATGFKTKSSR